MVSYILLGVFKSFSILNVFVSKSDPLTEYVNIILYWITEINKNMFFTIEQTHDND